MIKHMRLEGAAGPDDIPPTFLKAFCFFTLNELLDILFNQSFRSGKCAEIWGEAIIIPLHKAGRSPSEVKSYHPVSLTSVVKTMERRIHRRLYFLAESQGWIRASKPALASTTPVKTRSSKSPS